MTIRWVKPCAPQGTAPKPRPWQSSLRARPDERWPRNSSARKNPNQNAAERLAAGRKTVSFGQCRFGTEAAVDNEARMADRLAASTTLMVVYSYVDREPWPVGCGAFMTVLSTPVDNHVDSCHQQQFGVGPGRCVVD
jgi:hypothetical protein